MWFQQIYLQAAKLFPSVLDMLTDISDRVGHTQFIFNPLTRPPKVLNLALQVIATLSMSEAGQERSEGVRSPPKGKTNKVSVWE